MKKYILIFGLISIVFFYCKEDDRIPVSVESVSLSEKSLELEKGETTTLSAMILPKEANNKAVTWESSKQAIAAVDGNGNITALKEGKTSIIIKSEDGNKTDSCEVTVLMPGFTDNRDGTHYKVVKIGKQIWMAENLKYLPSVNDSTSEAKYYVYGYNGTDVDAAKQTENYKTYGVLYNWEAAKQACPEGWHLPSDAEWQELEMELGMSRSEVDSEDWRGTNQSCQLAGNTHLWTDGELETNIAFGHSGFTALPSGTRSSNNLFYGVKVFTYWWSATQYDKSFAWSRYLVYYKSNVYRYYDYKSNGFSVRCVKD